MNEENKHEIEKNKLILRLVSLCYKHFGDNRFDELFCSTFQKERPEIERCLKRNFLVTKMQERLRSAAALRRVVLFPSPFVSFRPNIQRFLR